MKLIVGLGNPEDKYQKTRHNFGFLAIDHLLKEIESVENTYWEDDKKRKSLVKKVVFSNQEVLLAKPLTFMNNSGAAVAGLASFYKIFPDEIFVLHDDLDIPIGKIKVRFGGAAAGHKGVQSIIDNLKTDRFLRIRLGIGKEFRPARSAGGVQNSDLPARQAGFKISKRGEDYVLDDFRSDEKGKVRTVLKEAKKVIELLLSEGIEKYMSKYNKKP